MQPRRQYRFAFQQNLARQLARQGARQKPGRAAVGRQADLHIGHHELGRGAGYDHVARQGQRESGAGRSAFHGRDHRLRARAQRLDPAVQVVDRVGLFRRILAAVFEQAIEIATGTKEVVGAGQDHRTNRIVAFGGRQGLDRRGVHVGMECILRTGVGKGENQRGITAGSLEFGGHRVESKLVGNQ